MFEHAKEPLFGRAGQIMKLGSFKPSELREILSDFNPKYTSADLLALYTFTGGIAWYVELFMKNQATTFNKMIRLVVSENFPFLNEGKILLIEKFGKEYSIYFSILECIAHGLSTRSEIESSLGHEVSSYLLRLEKDFGVIHQQKPIYTKSPKQGRYEIEDNFLTFWFRLICKYQNYIESGNFELLEKVIRKDYSTFSGVMLEKYFKEKYIESGKFTDIGRYWDRKRMNEIDLIVVNEQEKTVEVCKIKRNEARFNLYELQKKTAYFLKSTKECRSFTISYRFLSIKDM
jgi:AAA+ ATPase superfamily predicted ATPase